MSQAFRVGVDIGGTFTDIVLLDAGGRIHTRKVSSSVDDYARAIVDGLREVFDETGLGGHDLAEVLHGTTVASNAILELKGARTGLITTKGFRDVLEIRRIRMPKLYDLSWEKPVALVERALRLEVTERVDAQGRVQTPLDPAEVERVLDRLLGERIEALAVCLLNSYANPEHEARIAEIVRKRAPGLTLSVSAEVLPEIREYERTSTTVINAYVMPIVRRYLRTLRGGLDTIGAKSPLMIMQSNGGLMTDEAAAAKPVHVIESGPAAGVVGAQSLARKIGLGKLVTFDMGGTTAKASIVEDGEVSRATEYQVGGGIMHGSRLLTGAGYLLRVPAIDLAEVGAGGGSLVWIDPGGSLQVGPRSAGAFPGPLCYDLGGTEPTVTDANVILGFLNPRELAGGAVKLNAARAHEVFEARIARPMGLPLAEAAFGAHVIAASNMMRAIRAVSSERGRDPREYALFAFGGNGPLFAAGMAQQLEMRRIVVPPAPGLFSSFGLLFADVEHHYVRTWRRLVRGMQPASLGEVYGRMEADARAQLASEGFRADAIRIRRSADCRYEGQSFELTVPVSGGPFDGALLKGIEEAFGREHQRTYGHRAGEDEPVEIVSLRVVGLGIPDRPRVPDVLRVDRTGPGRNGGARRVYFGPELGWRETPIIDRPDLATPRHGPVIVEEYDATCVVPPGARAALDAHGNIVVELGQEI
ncbi:MAG: hydantoinase/oxoprolinase family protein [Candidatus Rokubacteria bacterium]|nr:hydantoinase/oxoprolinase family protein [Candidatus Rokubacteria bacterium]